MSEDIPWSNLSEEKRSLSQVARDRIALPFSLNETSKKEESEILESSIGPFCQTFRKSLEEVVALVSLPYTLISQATLNEIHMRHHIAGRIHAKANALESGDEALGDESEARKYADERTKEAISDREGQHSMFIDSLIVRLNALAESEMFGPLAGTQLRQSLILAWNSFEILVRDLIEVELNEDPHLFESLRMSDECKKRFDFRSITFERLSTYGFDLSKSLGKMVVETQDFSDISSIRPFLTALLGKCDDFDSRIKWAELYNLCKARHLIVHRNGVVDSKFLSFTNNTQKVGEQLLLKPSTLKVYVQDVWESGIELMKMSVEMRSIQRS